MLDQLRLRPITRRAVAPDEVEVEVCAAGINFRDVMKALGVYPGDAPDAVLLTHAHPDHTGFITEMPPEVPIYATVGTSKMMLA
ncbi:MAG: MBL fold metallo-hydrolase, partial [Verrucomicrobiota bacterium]